MKFFRKLALAALLTVLLTGTCLARETFHGAYLQGLIFTPAKKLLGSDGP